MANKLWGWSIFLNNKNLCFQIQKVVLALGDYMGASCYACIGGTSIRSEVQKLQAEAPHIVVGTPGRVFDMLTRKNICKLKKKSVLCPGSRRVSSLSINFLNFAFYFKCFN